MSNAALSDPFDAREALLRFARRCGEGALRLAMHAAVPQVLRLDLVHLLRINFVREADVSASEADVLLAEFTEPLGADYFELAAEVRRQLLDNLRLAYAAETPQRLTRVGQFLLEYLKRLEAASRRDPLLAQYLSLERWVALAFADPERAAHQFAEQLEHAVSGGSVATLQLGGLAPALNLPLARYPELLAYAEGLHAVDRGNNERAQSLLEALPAELTVGDIRLRPGAVRAQIAGDHAAQNRGDSQADSTARQRDLPGAETSALLSVAGVRALPARLDRFVSRESSVSEILALLHAGHNVLLEGPTGIGKLTLALEVARSWPGPAVYASAATAKAALAVEGEFQDQLLVIGDVIDSDSLAPAARVGARSRLRILATTTATVEAPAGFQKHESPPMSEHEITSVLRWQDPRARSQLVINSRSPFLATLVTGDTDADLTANGQTAHATMDMARAVIHRSLQVCHPEARLILDQWPSGERYASASNFAAQDASRRLTELEKLRLVEKADSEFILHPFVREIAQRTRIPPLLVISPAGYQETTRKLDSIATIARLELVARSEVPPNDAGNELDLSTAEADPELYDFTPYHRVLVAVGSASRSVWESWSAAAQRKCKPVLFLLVDGAPPSRLVGSRDLIDFRPPVLAGALETLRTRLAELVSIEGQLFGVPPLPPDRVDSLDAEALAKGSLIVDDSRPCFAFYGQRGIGKTALTIKLANDCDLRRRFGDGILMLDSSDSNRRAVSELVREWATRQGISLEQPGAFNRVLFILNGAEERQDVQELMRFMDRGAALLITAPSEAVVADIPYREELRTGPRGVLLLARGARTQGPGNGTGNEPLTEYLPYVHKRRRDGEITRLTRVSTQTTVSVYVSYSWDSAEHRARVANFAERLVQQGINVHLDEFYIDDRFGFSSPSNWDEWRKERVEHSDRILLVCSAMYRKNVTSKARNDAVKDVEAMELKLKNGRARRDHFIPVGFGDFEKFVPQFIKGERVYDLTDKKVVADLVLRLKRAARSPSRGE